MLAKVLEGINKAFTTISGEEILEIKVDILSKVKYNMITKWLGTQMPF